MGIRGLLQYIKKYSDKMKSNKRLNQVSVNNDIYISNVIYLDYTAQLIKMYYKHINSVKTPREMINIMVKDMIKLFDKMLLYNNNVYVFVDYKVMEDIDETDVVFSEYIISPNDIDDEEYQSSTPILKKEYYEQIMNEDVSKLIMKVRCMFELERVYNLTESMDDYVNLMNELELANKEGDKNKINILQRFINQGWYRYIILRGGKHNTSLNRLKAIKKRNANYETAFPFTVIIHAIPTIVKKLYKMKPNYTNCVSFFGCSSESDFSIVKHVKIYNRNSYPTICTNDTDLILLLNDIDCVVNFTYNENGKIYTASINPKQFWINVFGKEFDSDVIKMIVILMGSDYNHFTHSPIRIKSIEEFLVKIRKNSFEELSNDDVRIAILKLINDNVNKEVVEDNEKKITNDICVKYTVTAFNIYLNDSYGFSLISGTEYVNINRFIIRFNQMFNSDDE